MIDRLLTTSITACPKSVLLLGPRQVGKSTLIQSLKPDLAFNLALETTFIEFASNPNLLVDLIERKSPKIVFLDEIQRLPSLLNTIQAIIDDQKIKFYLTGSSARKLKRGGANLLPGRVVNFTLSPLTLKELNYKIKNEDALRFGFLPEIITTKDEQWKKEILISYSANYLKEEIKAEALTRSLEAFARFLAEITIQNTRFIDYTKIAAKARISRHTCPTYFEILEDTLLGYRLYPDAGLSEQFDLIKHPKFFLFDSGIWCGLKKEFELSPSNTGTLSEQLVFSQILHSAQAQRKSIEISTFRTRGGLEVDFMVKLDGKYFPIEVKYSDKITSDETRPLQEIAKHLPQSKPLLIHMGKQEKKIGKIWCLPLVDAIRELGL